MYLAGVSVRRVEDITEHCGATKVSPATISSRQEAYVHIEVGATVRYRPGGINNIYVDGKHDGVSYIQLKSLRLKHQSLLYIAGVLGG